MLKNVAKMKKIIVTMLLASFTGVPFGSARDRSALRSLANDYCEVDVNKGTATYYAHKEHGFGVNLLTAALLSMPLAYVLYNNRYSTLKEYIVVDTEGITIAQRLIRWKEVYKVTEKSSNWFEIRTEEDEKIRIAAGDLVVTAPRFMKIIDYYWLKYKIEQGKKEQQTEFPKIDESKYVVTQIDKDEQGNKTPVKTTFYKSPWGTGAIILSGFSAFLGLVALSGARNKEAKFDEHGVWIKTPQEIGDIYIHYSQVQREQNAQNNLRYVRIRRNGDLQDLDLSRFPGGVTAFRRAVAAFAAPANRGNPPGNNHNHNHGNQDGDQGEGDHDDDDAPVVVEEA